MHSLGIDVSKEKVDCALLTPRLRVVERSVVPNDLQQMHAFLQGLKKRHPRFTVGVESTGMFHLETVEACTLLGMPCRLLNPLLTKEFLKSSIRKKKTDREDAVVIAKLIAQGEGTPTSVDQLRSILKTSVRSARKVGQLERMLRLHVRHVERLLGSVPLELLQEQERLGDIEKSLQQDAVAQARCSQHTLLQSLPGIGAWLAAVILGETGGNILRYRSGDALVAAAGMDPRVRQSGATLNARGRLTKRGSPHLRWALFNASVTASRCDPEIHAYYERKRAEGKKHKVAMCAVTRKLIYRIHAVVKRGTPYVKERILH